MKENEFELYSKVKNILCSSNNSEYVKINPSIHRINITESYLKNKFILNSIDSDFSSSNLVFIEDKMLGVFLNIEGTLFEQDFGWESLFVPLFVHSKYVPGISGETIRNKTVFNHPPGFEFFNDCVKLNQVSHEDGEFLFGKSRAIMFELEMEDIIAEKI